ncbi:TRL family protein [Helicobacter suis]|uniref:TRL family protein n=1 Tax=Helicobacter suis TaxID=104628 RepID=A0ABM7L0J0_9HELI|nr:TRL family protein [Helicobacter suis]BCD47961.1 TRL family protein [Helicobacter suis]BDR27775.1 TRL family protein [Helicobacter suis HS1]GFK17226.1 TRL family protein [Helicobacter suis]
MCVCVGVLVSGCASPFPVGILFTGVTLPVSGNNESGSKRDEAICHSILGIAAFGDCSVEKAAQAGGIKTIKSVDRKVTNILGLYGHYVTIVKGD